MPLRRARSEADDWRHLESGGGRHELPDREPPAEDGFLWFFDAEGGYATRSVDAIMGA